MVKTNTLYIEIRVIKINQKLHSQILEAKNIYYYICNSPDHFAPNCPKRNQNQKSSTGMAMVQSEMTIPTVSQKCDKGVQDHKCVSH